MLKENKDRFSFSYESDATSSYLVLGASASEQVLGYQVEMLTQNPIDSILRLDVRHVDDKINLYYNITSKMALSQLLQRRKLKRNEFIDILKSIIKTVLDSKNHFLADTGFLLEEEYIYIDPATLETALLYIPFAIDGDLTKSCKTLVTNMMVCSAQIDESSSDNFIQRILNFLKSEQFNINDFQKLLIELRGSVYVAREESESTTDIPQQPPRLLQTERETNVKSSPAKVIPEKPRGQTATEKANTIKPKPSQITNKITKKVYRKNVLAIVVLSQLLILIIVALLSITVLSSPEGDTATIAGAVIIAGALDFLLLRKLLDRKNMVEIEVVKRASNVEAEEKQLKNVETPQNVNLNKREIYSTPVVQNLNLPEEKKREYDGASQSTEFVGQAVSLDTVLLGYTPKLQPCLKAAKAGMVEKIVISKPSFIIGRLREQVDYVAQNNAIGKVHAEIITKEKAYYIKDLNSKNGTYINDKRINSNIEYEIKGNDKIKFANTEYIFGIE